MKPLLVIPMTGISSRFTAAGYDVPKFMLEVDGQTVIEHVLDMYPDWEDVVFCCNRLHLDDPVLGLESLLRSKRPRGIVLAIDHNVKGPGWAVLQAREHIPVDRPVVVNYCDFTAYTDPDVLADELSSGRVDGCIPCYTGFHPHMQWSTSYAYVRMNGGLVADIQEKEPWTEDPSSEWASSGTYAFASGRILLDGIQAQVDQGLTLKDEYYLSLTYKPLLAAGGRVSVLPIQHFMQWGTPQDFEEYREMSGALAAWDTTRPVDPSTSSPMARVVLASGAGSRFTAAGYGSPKPALPLGGTTLVELALRALPGEAGSVIVTRSDLDDHGAVDAVAERTDAVVVTLSGLSEGQAISARAGIESVAPAVPLTVTACDALSVVPAARIEAALDAAGPNGLVVWTARPYSLARRRPAQYGWVEIDDAGAVRDTWLKTEPPAPDAAVIIGTFSFPSAAVAVEMIDALVADNERVNGEFYLDSLVRRAAHEGRPVIALEVPSFVSVGTPAEYETVRYWQSCFHKWALHPYGVSADPAVPRAARAWLDREFRRFDGRPTSESVVTR